MDYILSQKEFDALTPVKRLQNRNEALEKAREIILEVSNFKCRQELGSGGLSPYCSDCPIYKLGKREVEHNSGCVSNKQVHSYICIRAKHFPK